MRIYAGSRDDAANYYRLTAPLGVLRYRTGHEVRAGRLSAGLGEYWDVLWLQQYADPTTELLMWDFQAEGGHVVYDVDDWLFGVPASWPCYDHYFFRGQGKPKDRLMFHERLIRRADVVTASTPYLARKLEEHLELEPESVKVLPNCVLMGDWDIVSPTAHGLDGPVLGWFGTENHWDDWWEIAPYVDEALEEVGGHLALLGAPELVSQFPARLAARTQVYPLVKMRDFDQVRRMIMAFDVGLAWCTDRTEASRCRSPLKALQYGVARVPVVASQTVYGEVPGLADQYGLVVDEPAELTGALVRALSTHHDVMRKRAKAWLGVLWDRHCYETQAKHWLEIVESFADESDPGGLRS